MPFSCYERWCLECVTGMSFNVRCAARAHNRGQTCEQWSMTRQTAVLTRLQVDRQQRVPEGTGVEVLQEAVPGAVQLLANLGCVPK